MIEAWNESEDGVALVITFEGADRDEAAARDAVSETALDRLGRVRWMNVTIPDQFRRIFLILLGLIAGFLTSALAGAIGSALDVELGPTILIAFFTLGLVLPTVILPIAWDAFQERRARRRLVFLPPTREVFTLRIDPAGLAVESDMGPPQAIALDAIDGFESGRRLAVRRRDGAREELRCVLPFFNDHHALAARLDAAVRRLRVAGADYRGIPHVRVATSPSAEEEIVDEEEIDAKRKRTLTR